MRKLKLFWLIGVVLVLGCREDSTQDPLPDEPIVNPERLSEQDLSYLGAFRLPDEFNWGALGMGFYPAGNAGQGSLLITGLTTRPAEFGEVSIPTPVVQADWQELPMAVLQNRLRNFAGDLVESDLGGYAQYASPSGIEYVPAKGSQRSPKLYGTIDCWYCVGDDTYPTVFMSELDGSNPRGMFHVGRRELPFHGNKSGDYLFSVPPWYADGYLGGRTLITGKSRGTEFGSMGPTLFAFKPWETDNPSGDFDALTLLWYRFNMNCASPNVTDKSLCDYPGFTMGDKWEGGAFLEIGGKSAIVLFGRKGLGSNFYGESRSGDCSIYKGYHADPFERQAIFYDVLELAAVAAGSREPWTVVPYHIWRPTEFYNRGAGGQSCSELGGVAYDPSRHRLYVIEKSLPVYNADDQAVVHVWQLN